MENEPIDITGANVRNEKKYTVADLADSPAFQAYVRRTLAPKFAWIFHTNPDDLEQDFWVKILKPSQLLKEIDHPHAWAKKTMLNLCRNQYRDTKWARELTKPLDWEDGHISDVDMEDEAAECDERKDFERLELLKKQKAEICSKVMSILETLEPEERLVVHLFLMTIPAQVIAMQIQKSTATVYRMAQERKVIWKRIVTELGVEPLQKNRSAKTALIKLVASSLRDNLNCE